MARSYTYNNDNGEKKVIVFWFSPIENEIVQLCCICFESHRSADSAGASFFSVGALPCDAVDAGAFFCEASLATGVTDGFTVRRSALNCWIAG